MSSPVAHYRILVVDDTPSIHDDFRKILTPDTSPAESSARVDSLASAIFGRATPTATRNKFSLDSAMQGEEGLARVVNALAENRPYAVAFVDMRIPPGWDGLETIRHLWDVDPQLQIVICTAYSDHSWAAISERIGHSDNLLILKKPFDHIEVLQLAHALSRKWQLAQENANHLSRLDNLVRERTYQLNEAEKRFTEAFNASPLAQAVIDLQHGQFLDINAAFEKQFGVSRSELSTFSGRFICHDLYPTQWPALIEGLRSGQPVDEHHLTSKNDTGDERHLRCSARTIAITSHSCAIVVIRDVTEQLAIEKQLRQSQKLEAIGQLTAGIAHDFNNLLTVIQSYTEELLLDRPDAQTRAMLDPVRTATTRAASLVRQLLVFSRKEVVQPQVLDLCAVCGGLHNLLRRLIGSHVSIDWAFPQQLPLIMADPANLELIIVNLVINARDAMPDGGRVRIAAKDRLIEADPIRHPEAKPGSYIEIEVSDTGTGIKPDVLPHIFEPFFTTKETGKGTGLGLSTVYSIVKQHGGWIEVDSVVGTGTIFKFYHPVDKSLQLPPQAPHPDSIIKTSSTSNPRQVLVVEDDPSLQKMLATILDRRGIKYSLASDGVAALTLWTNSAVNFDMLITDIVMPNSINGLRLARSIREQNPKLGVILMSGHSEAATNPKNLQMPGEPPKFLSKPFTPAQLIAAIAEVYKPLAY